MNVSHGWLTQAEAVATSTQPATDALSIMGASLIFAAICWHIPKLLVGVLGGSPSLGGSDIVSTVGTTFGIATVAKAGAMTVAGWATGAANGVMSAAQAAGVGSGGTGSGGSTKALPAIAGGGSPNMPAVKQPLPPSALKNTQANTRIPPPKT